MARAGTVFFIAFLAIIATAHTAHALKTNVKSAAPMAKAEEPTSAVTTGMEDTAVTRYSSSGYYKGGQYYKYGKNPRHPRHPRHHGRPSKSCPCKCYRHEHQATRQCRRYRGYCGIVSCGYHRYPYKGYSCCGSGHYKPGHHEDYSDYYEEYYGKDYYGDDYYGEDYYGKDYKSKHYYGGEYYDDENDGHRKNW